MRKLYYPAGLSLLLAVILTVLCIASAVAEDINYTENEWNYVDGSMDVSHGIPENATGVLGRIRRNGVLRVATEPYFAPQEFIDPDLSGQDRFVGADMKLARLIAERMGVELVIMPMEFSQVLPALTEDQCDLTVSAISFTPGRATAYALSKGYYYADSEASTGFVIREADREEITSIDSLKNKTIIAQSTSLQESLAASHIYQYKEFRRVSSIQTVYEAVQKGTADAGVVDLDTAKIYIENNPDAGLCIVDGMYFKMEEQYLGDRIAAKKGELQLVYFVNGVIDEVLDGDYDRWIEESEKRAKELGL